MNTTIYGDCRETLRLLRTVGVQFQCCVTSPPYFGLRNYNHPGQLGLESTPGEYIATMVEVFRLVRDVLADDAVLWLNLGDSYFSRTKGTGGSNPATSPKLAWKGSENGQAFSPIRLNTVDLKVKPKDLIGIPWRVAFALQEDGWYLRQDIIWHKTNPQPESVTDRCTKAHEYLFMLTKNARYYFDNDAIKEASAHPGRAGKLERSFSTGDACAVLRNDVGRAVMRTDTRNRRSVWTIPTKPYKGAHFAVFPPALVEPCILAGSRPGDIVLDPFMGSGTVAQVAQQHGRRWLGCELNQDYEALIDARTSA